MMQPFTRLTSIAAPLLRDNVDTDTIIPSREIKSTGRTGLADGLFAPWRYQDAGDPAARRLHPEFVLNQPGYRDAKILVSGANFGCGSSREHAVWALAEWGFRSVIAKSFAPIFRNNCIRNGLLPVVLDAGAVAAIAGQETSIDLSGQTVSAAGKSWSFDIDHESKTMLLEGLDVIDLTLKHAPRNRRLDRARPDSTSLGLSWPGIAETGMIDIPVLKARNAALNALVDWDEAAAFGEGALAGLTVGIKSNIMVAGLPWTGGMGLYRARIAERDAAMVAGLREAGAAILGSLNMHEAALGATTDNVFYGRTHNAHRHGYSPGGSSGGSGAAVAAGLCDVALGTDTLGSVRIPAAYNGVYGLKPTNGAVSNDGLAMLEPRFDCIGPLARDLDVLERVWGVMSVPSPRSPSASRPSPLQGEDASLSLQGRGTGAQRQGEGAWRILTLANYPVDTQPAVAAALDCALANLPAASPITLPDEPTTIRLAGFVAAGRWLATELGDWRGLPSSAISDELRFMLDLTAKAEPREDVLARTRATLLAAIGDDGVLIMPTAPQAAFAHGGRAPSNQADFTCLANIAGLPALAIPGGRDETGLPVSVQLVGPPHSEAALIDLARQLIPALGGAVLPEGA